ncbi:MAG: DegT/DnrJ/EryC1/StrS aminotransferase family protein [Calditerrivibrio sp.]|nr:DegT/DnrJ/EryC1/StrS aminotransferase family protein [Calditerrivibrio sp.]
MKKVEFFKHNIGKSEINEVNKVLRSIFLTNHNKVEEFESSFANYLGVRYAIGLNSCSSALLLSLKLLGVSNGDEVITTPLTFVATVNAILNVGAKPVFVDVDCDTGLIREDDIEKAITKKTKAIIPVHIYGNMCNIRKISMIAKKYNLKVIEDSAHCIEGIRDNIRPGQLSDSACFSFYATKNITSGEGGAIVTNNFEFMESLKICRNQGMNKDASKRYTNGYKHWDVIKLGFKYNMSDIQAALLLPQLKRIDVLWESRQAVAEMYEYEFSKAGINYIKTPSNSKSARHLFVILTRNRDEMLDYLQENGIGVAVNYRIVTDLKLYRDMGYVSEEFPNAKKIGDMCISLPLYPSLKVSQIKYVIKKVKSGLKKYDKI